MAAIDLSSTHGASTATPRRLLLVSVPRTASNLLLKILNIHNQPNFLTCPKGGYFYYPAFLSAARGGQLAKSCPEEWSDEEKHGMQSIFQDCFDSLEEYSAQAQLEGKRMFAKEHALWIYSPASFLKMKTGHDDAEFSKAFRAKIPEKYGPTQTYSPSNETILSDEYLRTWQLAFIIRHPALAWPSMYRAMSEIAAAGVMGEDGVRGSSFSNMSLRWTRLLYDWCKEQPDVPAPPPVVDAHDLIHSPEVVLRLCELTGLDKSVLQFEWDKKDGEKKPSSSWAPPSPGAGVDEQYMHRLTASIMLSSLEGSKGLLKEKAPANIDIPAEASKWKVEFGEEVARLIEKAVLDAMPDYEYLKAHRIMVSS